MAMTLRLSPERTAALKTAAAQDALSITKPPLPQSTPTDPAALIASKMQSTASPLKMPSYLVASRNSAGNRLPHF